MKKHEQISRLFERSNLTPTKTWPKFNEDADASWIVSQSGLPWLRLDVEIPAETILAEIEQAKDFLVDHRDDYGEHRGWRSFCIHGKSVSETQHCEDSRPYHWIPEVEQRMPRTVEFFKSWPKGNYHRIRVMALEPGGYISLHQDNPSNYLAPINIAITQPKGCRFIMKGWGEVPFAVGDAYMLDVGNLHAVFNDSDQIRYHIIVHFDQWTDNLKNQIVRSYKTAQ